jgi:hypothetical protein
MITVGTVVRLLEDFAGYKKGQLLTADSYDGPTGKLKLRETVIPISFDKVEEAWPIKVVVNDEVLGRVELGLAGNLDGLLTVETLIGGLVTTVHLKGATPPSGPNYDCYLGIKEAAKILCEILRKENRVEQLRMKMREADISSLYVAGLPDFLDHGKGEDSNIERYEARFNEIILAKRVSVIRASVDLLRQRMRSVAVETLEINSGRGYDVFYVDSIISALGALFSFEERYEAFNTKLDEIIRESYESH